MSKAYFTPASFKFLKALKANNNKPWFAEHKAEYEACVKAPCLTFITDLAAPLSKISAQMIANPKPIGGSLFRIHRDARFSADKSPYKTHAGMSFYHAATKATARAEGQNAMMGRLDAPGFYLHIEPGECFVGGGLWHPQGDTLKRVRGYMVSNPASWRKATQGKPFSNYFTLEGDSLQRPPQGYDPAHELITDLKRKDFIGSAKLTQAQVCSDELLPLVLSHYKALAPMIDWLCGAIDLDF
ncbi:MAG: DUF2461 domain-containing protein [Pseudomonadota bacterium]